MAGGTKKRKYKKGKACNVRYKSEQRHEKGHVRRLKKHISMFGGDTPARVRLVAWAEKLGAQHVRSANEFLSNTGG